MNFLGRYFEEFQVTLAHHNDNIVLSIEKYLIESIQVNGTLLIGFISFIEHMDCKLEFLEIPLNNLILRAIGQGN